MSDELQATLECIAEQQAANTDAIASLIERQTQLVERQTQTDAAIASLAERQTQTDTAIARLVQMTERLAPQVIENTERLNELSNNS